MATNYQLRTSTEQPAQLLLRPIEMRLHGSERYLHRFRQVFVLHPIEVVCGDEQTMTTGRAATRSTKVTLAA